MRTAGRQQPDLAIVFCNLLNSSSRHFNLSQFVLTQFCYSGRAVVTTESQPSSSCSDLHGAGDVSWLRNQPVGLHSVCSTQRSGGGGRYPDRATRLEDGAYATRDVDRRTLAVLPYT